MANKFRELFSDRKKKLLALVVEHYIMTGDAIGSKALAERMGNTISSATIRNELADLTEMGLLEQPHTSAGRVPTAQGYRFYLDHLMQSHSLAPEEKAEIDRNLDIRGGSIEELVSKAGDALSRLTMCVSISAAPFTDASLRRVELFPMSARSAVVALMTSSGMIKSRIAVLGADISSGKIFEFLRVVNGHLDGRALGDITQMDFSIIAQTLGPLAFLFSPVLDTLSDLIAETRQSEIFLKGERHLLEQADIDRAVELIRFLTSKEALAEILSLGQGETRVVMGDETGIKALGPMSVVVSEYRLGGRTAGAIGLIASPQTDYASLVPRVEYFPQALGRLIEHYSPR